MNAKKFGIATVAAGVVSFLTGWLFYGVLFRDFMEARSPEGLMKEMPDMLPLIVGELFIAAFLTLILSKWEGITGFGAGAKAGVILGLLFGIGLNLVFYATSNMMDAQVVPVDALINTVRVSLAGGVIGLVLGRP